MSEPIIVTQELTNLLAELSRRPSNEYVDYLLLLAQREFDRVGKPEWRPR